MTTLGDAGPGSFREAVSRGPRTVVFDVGGSIVLRSPVSVHSDITRAGQTALGDGVDILGQEVSFSGSHNVIVRDLRFRQGLGGSRHHSALGLHAGHNMIFDHVSAEWGRWDTVDMNGSSDITIQDSIIGEGIDPQRFGCLCGSDNVTFLRDLFINNQSRSPKAKGKIQFLNNVIYNWGVTGFVGGHSGAVHSADVINNYFIKGPSSNDRFAGEFSATDHIYQRGNFADLNCNGRLDGRAITATDFGTATVTATPFAPVPVNLDTAWDAYRKITAGVGCSLHRDSVDARLIDDLTSLGTRGRIIRDPATVSGPPEPQQGR